MFFIMAGDPKDYYINGLLAGNRELYDDVGLSRPYLARKHKAELNAKDTKTIKVKGAVKQATLPRGWKVIATSGTLSYGKDGEEIYGDGDTVLMYKVAAWGIRQKARDDAFKMRGDIPPQKQEITGAIQLAPELTPEDREMIQGFGQKVVDAILSEHIRNLPGN